MSAPTAARALLNCHSSAQPTLVRSSIASRRMVAHSCTGWGAPITVRSRSSRLTSSASLPTIATSPLLTSSTASTPLTRARPSSDMATPSRSRSMPHRQVPWVIGSAYSWRCRSSRPHRIPASAVRVSRRSIASSSKANRLRTGVRAAKSRTSESGDRPVTRSRRAASVARTSLDCSGVRSAIRTRTPVLSANAADSKGANAARSGHMMMMSRGCRSGSSCSSPRTTSRTTSACRAWPWQEWTCRLRSSGPIR